MNTSTQPRSDGLPGRLGAFVSFLMAACVLFALGLSNAHALTAAGTVIGNQATATYNDAGGTARTATSNLVTTTVSQVKSFTLTASGARTAAPGQTVYYPHTITNTGNGTDTYTLNTPVATSGGFTHTGTAYYIDANGDGVPDNATPITTTGPLPAGGVFTFVLAGTVPAATPTTTTGVMTASVTDTSGLAAPVGTKTNDDTTTVATSVINVTKSLSVTSGPSPSAAPITVTLSYTNSGNSAATNVKLVDTLPAGMTYVATSGRWSVSGAAVLTDASDGTEQGSAPNGIDYSATMPGNVITAIIGTVPAGVSGTVTFQVTIDAGLSPRTITNTATFQSTQQNPPPAAGASTNGASYQVLQTSGVVANGSASSSVDNTNEPVVVPSAAAGSTFFFTDYVWNLGNATDTFDITISQNTFPSGSTVTLLQQDGASTLLNSSGTAAPDTGPVPAKGATCAAPFVKDTTLGYCGYKVVVKVTLPANATPALYQVELTATSAFDTTAFNKVMNQLTTVSANTVDLTVAMSIAGGANSGNAATTGFGSTGSTVITPANTVTPTSGGNTTTAFVLYVNNTGVVNDSFDLSAAYVAVPATLPAGWSVQFYADGGGGSCATVGASLSNTGTIAAGGNRLVCARVTVPATTSGTALAGNYDFDFKATSTTNAAVTDSVRNRVTVATVHSIIITPSNVQQTFPGGSVTYTHTITNSGNATDTVTYGGSCLTDSRSSQGWTSTAYIDNGDGTLTISGAGADTLVTCGTTTQTLTVGQSVTIFVRVFAPGSATSKDPADVTTITVTYNTSATATATDTTSVTDGLLLLKEQAPVGCSAASGGTYVTTPIPPGAATAPGQCIAYRITATNTTAGTITNVVLSDIVPANTTMKFACSGNGATNPTVTPGSMAGTSAADGATGTVIANVGTLTSTQAAVLYFCVQINP